MLSDLGKEEVIDYLRASDRVKRARALKSEGHGGIDLIRNMFSLVRLLFQKGPSMLMNRNPVYQRYSIGNYSYGFPEVCDSGAGARLRIGKFCSFSPGVKILLNVEHQIASVTTYPFDVLWSGARGPPSKGDVVIGNDVWVGYGAIILSGITIGDGAVVGAGAVVSHDIPPYAVVVGNPARIVKYRFDSSMIEFLLQVRWWDWSAKKIREWQELLMDVEGQSRFREHLSSGQPKNNNYEKNVINNESKR